MDLAVGFWRFSQQPLLLVFWWKEFDECSGQCAGVVLCVQVHFVCEMNYDYKELQL